MGYRSAEQAFFPGMGGGIALYYLLLLWLGTHCKIKVGSGLMESLEITSFCKKNMLSSST